MTTGDWRRESDKEMSKMGKHTCGSTHYQGCECQRERMAKLEQLARTARGYVEMVAFPHSQGDWRPGARKWLTCYSDLFPEVK